MQSKEKRQRERETHGREEEEEKEEKEAGGVPSFKGNGQDHTAGQGTACQVPKGQGQTCLDADTYCSCRQLGFNSQLPQDSSQPSFL